MVKINLEIDDKTTEYNLPENWDEVNIEQFCKIWEFDRQEMNTLQFATRIISSFTDIDEEVILDMQYTDFHKLCDILKFTQTEFQPEKNVEYIEIEGEKYFLKSDFSQLTMGEVISIETIIESGAGNIYKVMDKLLCIFLRKKKENGNLETFKGEFMSRSELFKKLPISKVFTLFSFFLTGNNISQNNTNPSLENQETKKNQKNEVDLK